MNQKCVEENPMRKGKMLSTSSVSNSSAMKSSDINASAALQAAEKSADSSTKETGTEQSSQSSTSGDFASFMTKALGGESKSTVNEEELFAALIEQRLEKSSPEAAEIYRQEKAKLSVSMARSDGYVPIEDVAKAALKATVATGKIEQAAAEKIHAESFAAAQLDDKKDVLYDGRGSEGDPTIATSSMEEAMSSMKMLIDQIESGQLSLENRSLEIPSNTAPGAGGPDAADGFTPVGDGTALSGEQALDGSGGFLWKPESERDGNLVVLLPTTLNGLIDRVEVHSSIPASETSKLGTGNFTSIANGDRSHWRFDKSGEEFGENVYVVAYKDNGDSVYWKIDNGGTRND